MSRDEVRRVLGVGVTPFMKGPLATFPTDAFNDLGLHVLYRAPGVCEAIEFGGRTSPTLNGETLLGRRFEEASQLLAKLDSAIEIDESGLTSPNLGVALYCPAHADDIDAVVEGVFVFEPGYYDDEQRGASHDRRRAA